MIARPIGACSSPPSFSAVVQRQRQRQRQRQHAENHRCRRHHDRPHACQADLQQRISHRRPGLARLIGKVHQQDRVLRHQAHQHHQTDHREHVQRALPQQQRQHHADQRQRQAAQPKLVTPVLQVLHRAITRFLLDQAGLKADEADSGAVTLIQPSLPMTGSAANLNIHLHCLVLDGVYRCDTEGEPVFVEVPAPTDESLQAVLHKIITRMTQAAQPSGDARRRAGPDLQGRRRRRFGRGPRALAVAGRRVHLPHRLRPTRRPEGADGARR